MTPKRYFAFGCLTALIQGGVLASQNHEPTIQLSEGALMGSNQAVSVMIAMQASSQAISAQKAPIEVSKPIIATDTKPLAKSKTLENKPPKVEAKAQPKPEPILNSEQEVTEETVIASRNIPETNASDTSKLETNDATGAHNQQLLDAKQGITQQAVALRHPTFSAPPTQPHYPKKARKRGFEGTATVEVMFNQIGEQLSLTLVGSSGYNLLDAAAIDAVGQWQFAAPSPQTALAYTVRVPVKFALN